MNYRLLILFTLIFCLGGFVPPAKAQYASKDSSDFIADDGIFSPEEKDEEADLIKQQCEISGLQQKYYNCSCLAGAFRIRRDEEKLLPQSTIMNELLNDKNSKCVDIEKIAGMNYLFCQEYAQVFRDRKDNNPEYCKCFANTVARKFSIDPRLSSTYIESLKVDAFGVCNAELDKPL